MPFDDPTPEGNGGGGGRDPHDPTRLAEIANAAAIQTHVNCETGGICMFHGHLAVTAKLLGVLTENLRLGGIDPTCTPDESMAIDNHLAELAELLRDASRALKEQLDQRRPQ